MENIKKGNIFSRIIDNIKKAFKKLDEILGVDIPNSNDKFYSLSEEQKKELEKLKESDHVVEIEKEYEEGTLTGIRRRLRVVEEKPDELEAKYGQAKPGNPIYDQGQKMQHIEDKRKEGIEIVDD